MPSAMKLDSKILSLSDFSYELDPELVAQSPLENRDQSKLLVRSWNGEFIHSKIEDLAAHLPPKTLLVFNDTKVFASRIFGTLPNGSSLEVFLLHKPEEGCLQIPCFLKPARKVKEGSRIQLGESSYLTVLKKPEKGIIAPCILDFSQAPANFSEWIKEHAYVPLPMYIKRKTPIPWNQSEDSERYQTVYAREEGSVAAPTAGLHFTKKLLDSLTSKGIQSCAVTLHVSSGTFLPVKSETISEHPMHTERYMIPSETWTHITEAKNQGYKIIAVGTTSLRAVESFIISDQRKFDQWINTNLFIYPKTEMDIYRSQIFDGILTNFHQPCSTLFMLICSLIGLKQAQNLYKEAFSQRYRLFSYGDSSLLWF